jgi:hypothetical protein
MRQARQAEQQQVPQEARWLQQLRFQQLHLQQLAHLLWQQPHLPWQQPHFLSRE